MSKLNKIFQSVPVPVPDRSGFDLSHESIGTATTGTVVPVTHFEVLPGDTISMGSMMRVTLPPFAVPFMGRIDAELTAAFIPYRLLWKHWQSFITQNPGFQVKSGVYNESFDGAPTSFPNAPYQVPTLINPDSVTSGYGVGTDSTKELAMYARGSLADYLGVKPFIQSQDSQGNTIMSKPLSKYGISALPFLAYHKFCDDWIRDDNVMKPFFLDKVAATSIGATTPGAGNGYNASTFYPSGRLCPSFGNGVFQVPQNFLLQPFVPQIAIASTSMIPCDLSIGLGSLRQRCWAKDYFTTATYRPQAGAESSVSFDTSGNTGAFTIASLRAANSLQKWLERNNIAGTDYGSQILAHFGVTPPDAILDRSVLLGSVRTPVVVNAVENNSNAEATSSRNPFGSTLGTAAGFGSAAESGRLVDNFEAKEHGIIMVFFTLIPHAYYNAGIDKQMLHIGFGDFAWPEFSGIGDQAIYQNELLSTGDPDTVFGYNQRYSEYKFKLDRISGLLQDGESLDVYALQRGYSTSPVLGSSFLEIPKDYLDQVFAVTSSESGFSCIFDCYFDCSALRVLPEYSLPKL